jgi:hypothetical protein
VENVFSFIGRKVCEIAVNLGLYDFDRSYCVFNHVPVGVVTSIVIIIFVWFLVLSVRSLRGL